MEARIPVMHFFDGFRTSHEVRCLYACVGGASVALLVSTRARMCEHVRAWRGSAAPLQGVGVGVVMSGVALTRRRAQVNKVKMITYKDIGGLIPWDSVKKHHDSALSPVNPHIQGTNQVCFPWCEARDPEL